MFSETCFLFSSTDIIAFGFMFETGHLGEAKINPYYGEENKNKLIHGISGLQVTNPTGYREHTFSLTINVNQLNLPFHVFLSFELI